MLSYHDNGMAGTVAIMQKAEQIDRGRGGVQEGSGQITRLKLKNRQENKEDL